MCRRFLSQALLLKGAIPLVLALGVADPSLCRLSFDPPVRVDPDTSWSQHKPSIAVDSEGNPCIVWVTWKAEIRFARSTDGGNSFLPSVPVDTVNWPICWPRIALDLQDNPHVIWTDDDQGGTQLHQVKYARSMDRGDHFLPSFHVEPDTTRGQFAGAIVANKGGHPMVVWHAYDTYQADDVNTDVYFARSYDGGLSFEPSVLVDPHPGYQVAPDIAVDDQNIYISYLGDHWSHYEYIFVSRSLDGGNAFEERVWVDRDVGNSYSSSIATALSEVMVVWNELKDSGSRFGVYFAKSTDTGVTFGDVVTVSEGRQGGACPVIAADTSGNPVVVWNDRMTDMLHFSYSENGGSTFLPEAPVDSVEGSHQGGLDVAMTVSGIPMVVWSSSRAPHSGMHQIYFSKASRVGIERGDTGEPWVSEFRLGPSFPNPFSDATTVYFSVARSAVSLKIYDSTGRLVRVLVEDEIPAGKYSVTWHGRDMSREQVPSGIYFCSLQAGDYSSTRKIILLK